MQLPSLEIQILLVVQSWKTVFQLELQVVQEIKSLVKVNHKSHITVSTIR